MKRIFDVFFSIIGLLFLSPILLIFVYLVYRNDKQFPFYLAPRVGMNGLLFNMVKLRSMNIGSDSNGVDSTAINDLRITPIGKKIRKYKLDELTQLWNVLIGDMSLVGPRPNVERGTEVYTNLEKKLLSVRPGITDFSSIVFSDEGEILKDTNSPDFTYNKLIRPWKSRLGLVYVDNQTIWLDFKLILITLLAIISKQAALKWVNSQLRSLNVDKDVINISRRDIDLYSIAPPEYDKNQLDF